MIKGISRLLSSVLTCMLVVLLILFGGVRLLGYTPYVITSGSMIPEYPVGSIVYVKEVSTNELAIGDDISFYINNSVIATHRIGEIDYTNEQIQTYGINNKDSEGNQINDAEPVDFDKIVGRVEFTIPALGYLYIITRTTTGKIAVVAIVVVLFGISKLLNYLYHEKEKKYEKTKKQKN